jgi:predicted NBD/HSP70 family sugar kinase
MAQWREDGLVRQWVLEEIASGPALFDRYRSLGGTAPSVRAVLDNYGTDAIANAAVDEAASALGIGLATLVNLLDPECLVVGGGLGAARGPHFELAVSSARAHIWAKDARNIDIVRAECGEDSAVVGAAMLAMDP